MKKDELIGKVAEELEHVPRGSLDQNMLRATYNALRRHDLSVNPDFPAKDSLRAAIEIARKDKPDFSPIYDRDFFGS